MYIQYKYSGHSAWNGLKDKNSEAKILTPGFGMIWTTKNKLGLAINFLYPNLLENYNLSAIESNVDSNVNSFQISMGIRKTFDYSIKFLE